ncbi:EF-hand domain-containing protein [Dinoroseobacter sp. S375]|uniref:EF-hand domain-containing protein n=1 Tax=Dinoroseobacter sp. S375 TaxID=3415136 RepID=UPI003C7CDD59
MKTLIPAKVPTTALLLVALTAGSIAMAAPRGDGAGHRGAPDFLELDTNGDGQITQSDLQAATAERFAALDADGNGQVSREEMAAAAETRKAERAERRLDAMLERVDANGDGQVSLEEFGTPERGSRMFTGLDTDGDGAISEEEFAARKRGPGRGHMDR